MLQNSPLPHSLISAAQYQTQALLSEVTGLWVVMDVQKHHPEEEKDKHHEEKKKKTPSGDYKQMNQCVKPVRGED